MIRKLQETDIDEVSDIWLDNFEAVKRNPVASENNYGNGKLSCDFFSTDYGAWHDDLSSFRWGLGILLQQAKTYAGHPYAQLATFVCKQFAV